MRSKVVEAGNLVAVLRRLASKLPRREEPYKIMTFCGTHEYVVAKTGIRGVLPSNVEVIPGPGCPVCVTPAYIVDNAIKLVLEGITVLTYGDAYMLPGIRWTKDHGYPRSLFEANTLYGGSRPVYSIHEAVREARKSGRETVFLAVGFETTAPATLSYMMKSRMPANLSLLVAHRLTPPIMRYALDKWRGELDGVIAPGHVSAITGASAWSFLPREHGIPAVVSGFEPEDVLESLIHILWMLKKGKPGLVNQYKRAVGWKGNRAAKTAFQKYFDKRTSLWRGLGWVPASGYTLREEYSSYNAVVRHGLWEPSPGTSLDELPPGCKCGEVTLGLKKPTDCPLFMKTCTPSRPYGPCMVGSEGTCRIWARTKGGVA